MGETSRRLNKNKTRVRLLFLLKLILGYLSIFLSNESPSSTLIHSSSRQSTLLT